MPRYDFTTQRMFMGQALTLKALLELDRGQANYLMNVLRLRDGDTVLVFNGRDGEWRAVLQPDGRKKAHLEVTEQTREQPLLPDLTLLFAPLKQARLEYMVQKAVEMGVGTLIPVRTDHTQAKPLKDSKAIAYIQEAAEQCGILAVPQMHDEMKLHDALTGLSADTRLIFCDEGEASQNPLDALPENSDNPLAVLIGPEGGFSEAERADLRSRDNVIAIPLGPRVLRADTAAVAALAIVQARLGDWR